MDIDYIDSNNVSNNDQIGIVQSPIGIQMMHSPIMQQIPVTHIPGMHSPIMQQVPVTHFGIVIAGRPLLTEFEAISESKYISFVQDPCSVAEITFFLIPSAPIPQGYGAILYYSLPPFTNWEIIGAIDTIKPSGTFRTGWSTNEEFYGSTVVQLGIALETLDNIKNLEIANNGVENRLAFAHKIALDLFQYMTSFSTPNQSSNQMMIVPTNIFDKWMERFDRKYKLDPNFMLKQSI